MGFLKEKKGFTLVELLAVIVILAVVTVIGATTVLPYIQNAQKDAFKDEANYVIDAATNAISLIQLNESGTTGNYTELTGTTKGYCFTLKNLVDMGLWTKDSGSLGTDEGQYRGTVVAERGDNTKGYTYKVEMTNGKYYVKSTGGAISAVNDDYKTASPTPTIKTAC